LLLTQSHEVREPRGFSFAAARTTVVGVGHGFRTAARA
jgi:hypothetical protein